MKLEFFENPAAEPARVLLLHGLAADDVHALRDAVAGLAAGTLREARLDLLRGLDPDTGCSLLAEVGEADLGVEPIAGDASAFRCVLTAAGWRRVFYLLEPFVVADEGTFQYLTEAGEIEWIVSTDRGW